MSRLTSTQLPMDTWITASWNDYLQVLDNPAYEKAKSYYDNGQMRIEMSPIGNDHSRDHSIIIYAIHLFAGIQGIDLNGHDNCTYRKTGIREVQPDVSFYVGETAETVPWGTGIVDLDQYPPPNLVIEVANTSLPDDKGNKRLLYEDLGVEEYWIIDVPNVEILAFAMENQGSRRIRHSQVLVGLDFSLLQQAFQKTRQMNHGKVSAWLLQKFQ
jgi:Uma2 family endonuclease